MSADPPANEPRMRRELNADATPRIARHAKMRLDETQQRWLLLVPEKVLHLSETAVEVLQLCDGKRTIGTIAAELARTYEAPPEAILADILPVLQDLADKGHVVT